jgi:hypothetical protein
MSAAVATPDIPRLAATIAPVRVLLIFIYYSSVIYVFISVYSS